EGRSSSRRRGPGYWIPACAGINGAMTRGRLELIELTVLGPDPAHRAGHRTHHYGLGLDHGVAELDAVEHAAVGDASRGEQAVAAHYVFDLIFLARILDAHLGGAFAFFFGVDDQARLHLAADTAQRCRRQHAFRRAADAEIDIDAGLVGL